MTVTLVAAALFAGCGGGGASDEQQVRDVVTSFVEAGRDRDAAKACSLLAEDQLKVVQRLGSGGCETVLGGIFSQAKSTRSKVTIEDVRVEGDRATVDATVKTAGSAPEAESILLVKEGGEWKLASAGL